MIMDPISRVQAMNSEFQVPALNLSHYADFGFHQYFLYMGSFTTPDCNEGVKWVLPTAFSYVSKKQVIFECLIWLQSLFSLWYKVA